MKRVTITEHDGLWKIETSDGKRASGATLPSAVRKLSPHAETTLEELFDKIESQPWGQVAHGQASG